MRARATFRRRSRRRRSLRARPRARLASSASVTPSRPSARRHTIACRSRRGPTPRSGCEPGHGRAHSCVSRRGGAGEVSNVEMLLNSSESWVSCFTRVTSCGVFHERWIAVVAEQCGAPARAGVPGCRPGSRCAAHLQPCGSFAPARGGTGRLRSAPERLLEARAEASAPLPAARGGREHAFARRSRGRTRALARGPPAPRAGPVASSKSGQIAVT
jgi:hypothetical protein